MDQRRSKFSESFSLDRYWSIECSSLRPAAKLQFVLCDLKRLRFSAFAMISGRQVRLKGTFCGASGIEVGWPSLGLSVDFLE